MSRFNVQLYVLGERLDLFEEDNISITLKIQDVRDIAKVFTDFTHTFTVPASSTNNRILKHPFKEDSLGIDTRGYHEAVLEINNNTFRRGYVQLQGAMRKSGTTNSYSLRFYGGLALLNQIFADDILKDVTSLGSLNPSYTSPDDFDSVWMDLLTSTSNQDLRIALNAFDKGYLYDSNYTDEDTPDINEEYQNIWYAGTDAIRNRTDVGVPIQDLKPSLRSDAVLRGIEQHYNISFSRGEDANGFPTSVTADVVKSHYFNSSAWLNEWMLLHNKSVDDSIGNLPAIPLTFDSIWGNVTPDIPSPTGLERFLNTAIQVAVGGAVGALTGGAGFALLGPAGFAAGLSSIGQGVLAGAVIGGSGGAYSSLFANDVSLNPEIFGSQERLLFNFDDDNEGPLLTSRYWIDANITKSGTGAYEVFLQDEKGNILWSTGTQTQMFRSADQDDFIELAFTRLSGGTCVGCEPNNRSDGQPIMFNDGIRVYNAGFFVRKEEGVVITVEANITSQITTRTAGVVFNDFQEDIRVTNNSFNAGGAPGEFSLRDELPKIKVIDWLSGHWKKFNGTARIEQDANNNDIIVVKDLDQFYDDGKTVDITRWVDSQDVEIKSPQYRSPVIFKYQDPSTFLSQEYDNKSERKYGYGSLAHDLNEGAAPLARLPYREYKVELPFEQVVLNPIQDTNNTDTDTDIVYGWIVSDSMSPTQTKPWIHYIENVPVGDTFQLNGIGTNNPKFEISRYNAPTKFLRDSTGATVQTLTFGTENDERTTAGDLGFTSNNTLFSTYYQSYIESIFNERAKIYKYKGRLPAALLTSIGNDDTLVIGNNAYRSNEIQSNVNDGKTMFELYSVDNTTADISFGQQIPVVATLFSIDTFTTSIVDGVALNNTVATFTVTLLNADSPSYDLYRNNEILLSNFTGSFETLAFELNDVFFIRATNGGVSIDTQMVTITSIEDGRVILDHNNDPITDHLNDPIIDTDL